MSKKRSQRNTKKFLKGLKAKRQKFYYGGYGGGGGGTGPAGFSQSNAGDYWTGQQGGLGVFEYSMLEGLTANERSAMLEKYDMPLPTLQGNFTEPSTGTTPDETTEKTNTNETAEPEVAVIESFPEADNTADLTSGYVDINIKPPTQAELDDLTGPTLGEKVWSATKGIVKATLTGAALGALAGGYYDISKNMMAKLLAKEAFKGAVIDEATGALLDAATGLPIVGAPALQAILDFTRGLKTILLLADTYGYFQ